MKNLERNIKFYTWFKVLGEPLFWGPVLVTYIINIGKMDLADMYFMESVVVFGMIFVEIYSSAWADLVGRKRTMILGTILNLIAIILFALLDSPLLVWISNILVMFGYAIVSGVDDAFLADTLKEQGRYGDFTRINGSIFSKRFILVAGSAILSGYLYSINPRLPMFLSIPGMLISLLMLFFLHEPKKISRSTHKEHFELMKLSVLFVANHKKIKWIIGFMALIGMASKLWFFTYNPYFELVALDEKYFGWIFAGLNIVAWFSSKYAYSVENKMSERSIVIFLIILIAFPMMLMGIFVSKISIIYIFFENLTRGFRRPFFSTFMNRHLDSGNRATVLSLQSAICSIVNTLALFLFGLLLKYFDIPNGLQILGIIILIWGMISVYKFNKLFVRIQDNP